MRVNSRTATAAAALVTLTVASTALAAGDNKSTEAPADNPAAPAAPEVTILNKHEVQGVLGREIKDAADENMGRIVDVLVDRGGRVCAAIIDFGGFLGVGNHRIAVDWPLLRFNPGRDPFLTLSLSREKLGAAPEYKEGAHPQTLMEPPAPASTAPAPPAEQNKK